MHVPSFQDVLYAQKQIRPYLARTPLRRYSALDELIETSVYVKHENYQPVGAFKVRGGINLISQLNEQERAKGVISASTGNHGQSIAYAARLFHVKARIVVPKKANPGKVAAIQGMGAEVIQHGANFDEARQYCELLAQEQGYRYIHSGNEPLLIAGVATGTLEIMEDEANIETIIVPIGGGSGAAGACIVAKAINPAIRVIGVQAEASPAAYKSWQQKQMLTAPNHTFAEGLATGSSFELPQEILWKHLDDFLLVSDDEIAQAMVWLIERAHTLAEPAGAASLAAAYRLRSHLHEKKIAIVCSGANTSLEQLKRALALT
jgi:threonine dehydratase